MSKLLLDDKPLIILPALANKVGLNEAIILQQLHYWLEKSNNEKEGHLWVYNTHEDWQKQFPFWSISTIRRAIKSLEDSGILITGRFNKLPIDKTKWYRIEYRMLDEGLNSPSVQYEQSMCSKRTVDVFNMNRPLPEITTEITTENKTLRDNVAFAPSPPYKEIIDYLNEKALTQYRSSSKKTQSLIKSRTNEGFSLDDFKVVVDKKTSDWLNDQKMAKFLRPETLFGTKFESYLNEKRGGRNETLEQPARKSNDTSGVDW